MLQIEKSRGFTSSECGSQPTGVQDSTKNCWIVLVVWTLVILPEDICSVRIRLLDPGYHKLSQKLLVNITVNPLAGRNQLCAA
jgi:hypothetical protein